jgi:murein hydrolase activator
LANSTAKTSKAFAFKSWRVRTLCVGALALGGIATAQTVEDERRALARAKAQSMLAEQRAEKLEDLAEEQLNEVEAVKARSAAVASRIQATEADISAAESRIALIDRMRTEWRAQLAEQQRPAIRLVAALQTLSRRPPALALVQPGSFDDLAHVRAVLASLMPKLRARTASLRTQIARGKELKADADRALGALEGAKDRLSGQRVELEQLAARKRQLADLTKGDALQEEDVAIAMGEKARDIGDLLDKVGEQGAIRDRLASLPGPTLRPTRPDAGGSEPGDAQAGPRVSIPYRLPVAGSVVTGLGEVSGFGVRSRGLTLATRPSAQIVAPSPGEIVFAGKFGSYGNIVIIDHGQGWTSVITSFDILSVSVGDSVLQGSPLGVAGEDRPQITVELRQKNQPVDITRIVS